MVKYSDTVRRVRPVVFAVLILVLAADISWGQTGKISGVVTDAQTGNPLPGVNVVVEETQRGATTNADGFYSILNLSPDTYTIQFSFVGYANQIVENVEVNTDLTTTVDVELQEEAVGLDEVTVQASEPVVKPDIASNMAHLNAADMENVPVVGVEEVLELQAGVEPGLSFRGGGMSQTSMVVDGMSMREGRNNRPFTNISYTSIKQVKVQTGGFSAKYGNVRSGLINVATIDPPRNSYSVDFLGRYLPPQQKHFGNAPDHPDAYWIDPFLPDPNVPRDEDVAFVGTQNGTWDRYTQNQYPNWQGWNTVADNLTADDNPDNDLTADQLVELFKWRHRKNFEISQPDYVLDGTIAGPIPVISEPLGNLRFLASLRSEQRAYPVPQQRETYDNWTGNLKLITNVSPGLKIRVEGMRSEEYGMHEGNWTGTSDLYTDEYPAYPWHSRGMLTDIGGDQRDALFAWHFWNLTDIKRNMVGGQMTHTVGPNTFYNVNIQRKHTDYSTYRGERRSVECAKEIGPACFDESPWGFAGSSSRNSYSGLRLAGHWGKPKDSSNVSVWQGTFDITSQLDQYNTVSAGLDFIYNDLNMNFGRVDSFHTVQQHWFRWHRQPIQAAAYAEDKLEFQGMIANVGLRLDYFNGNGRWYDYDYYDPAFSAKVGADNLDEALPLKQIDSQLYVSPRLGISFPISTNSKIYFNYGHFRQMLNPMNVFRVQAGWLGGVQEIGNPEHPMPRTIAYELGFERNLFNQYLLRLTGYYKDVTNQSRNVNFQNLLGTVNYGVSMPFNYADIRGFEASLRKNQGNWLRGFVNFTYMVTRSGNFGEGQHFENMAEQLEYLRQNRFQKSSPTPEPYANFNLQFLTPEEFGPESVGIYPLANWRLSLLGNWRMGQKFKWTNQTSAPQMDENVRWRDYYMFDLRLSKSLNMAGSSLQLFADISNVFNIRHMYRYSAFEGDFDFEDYMTSLHLPEDTFEKMGSDPYPFIRGDDRPGVFREPGTEYVPIEIVGRSADLPEQVTGLEPDRRVLYYVQQDKQYMEYADGSWQQADGDFVDEVLEEKKYINMPNASYFTFLNPRQVQFGLRFSF